MNTAPLVAGTKIRWFREGTSLASPLTGVAGRMNRPSEFDPSWLDLGIIDSATESPTQETLQKFATIGGVKVLYDMATTKHVNSLKFTLGEFQPLVVEALYRTDELNAASTQFNPMEGPAVNRTNRGWLHYQIRGHDGRSVWKLVFGFLMLSGDVTLDGESFVSPEFTFTELVSELNSGALA